jgi:hypothetical protein
MRKTGGRGEEKSYMQNTRNSNTSVLICLQSYETNNTSHLKYKGHGGLGVRWSNLIQRVLSVILG